jgi:hypothetical protein
MELSFATHALREVCANESKATAALGPVGAKKLLARLADLRAVDYLRDLPVGSPKFEAGVVTLSLGAGRKLVLECGGVPEKGSWQDADRAKILEIRTP